MAGVKDIRVRPISAADARRIVRTLHYSGKVCNNSQINLGVFLDGKCGGAMQFGPPMDRRKVLGLVAGTAWNEMIELNRMAFAEWLPRNSESRALGWALRWMHKQCPQLRWVLSFADATQSGDGTIYRAAGFVLTQIKRNISLWANDCGDTVAVMTATKGKHVIASGGAATMARYAEAGYRRRAGYQLRYIYLLDPACRAWLTVPEIPFRAIEEQGAGMYRGKAKRRPNGGTPIQSGEGGSSPTPALHTSGRAT